MSCTTEYKMLTTDLDILFCKLVVTAFLVDNLCHANHLTNFNIVYICVTTEILFANADKLGNIRIQILC